MKRRAADAAELQLWREIAKSVTPLRRRPTAAAPAPAAAGRGKESQPPRAAVAPAAAAKPATANPAASALDMDRRQAERFKRGRMPIDGKLDLHGMTQAEAHAALRRFIAGAAQADKRCLLVVTGKGLTQGKAGVLKTMAPRWLEEAPLRAVILAHAPAAARHGGGGAFYVLLKRRRPASPERSGSR